MKLSDLNPFKSKIEKIKTPSLQTLQDLRKDYIHQLEEIAQIYSQKQGKAITAEELLTAFKSDFKDKSFSISDEAEITLGDKPITLKKTRREFLFQGLSVLAGTATGFTGGGYVGGKIGKSLLEDTQKSRGELPKETRVDFVVSSAVAGSVVGSGLGTVLGLYMFDDYFKDKKIQEIAEHLVASYQDTLKLIEQRVRSRINVVRGETSPLELLRIISTIVFLDRDIERVSKKEK